jgi:DNA repair exonuclease SbcCD ATPase subunit
MAESSDDRMSDNPGKARKRGKKQKETGDDASKDSGTQSEELKKMEERLLKIENERKKELRDMTDERKELLEENKKLRKQIISLKEGLMLEDRRTEEVEHEIKDIEKKVQKEAASHGEILDLGNELTDIKNEITEIKNAFTEMETWKMDLLKRLEELEASSQHAEHVPVLKAQVDDIDQRISKKVEMERVQKIEKGIEDIFDDLDDLGEEMGYGESLNVAKVPPQVLESTYQTILDDLTKELKKSFGSHETEKIILNVADELRLRTTGSELFKVAGAKIELEDIVKSIEKGLISNKQVQMTYEELLKKLSEHVPHHKPKNLRAIMKIKSLEYAVDKLRILISEHEYVKKELERLMSGRQGPEPKDSKGHKYNIPDAKTETDGTTGGEESA